MSIESPRTASASSSAPAKRKNVEPLDPQKRQEESRMTPAWLCGHYGIHDSGKGRIVKTRYTLPTEDSDASLAIEPSRIKDLFYLDTEERPVKTHKQFFSKQVKPWPRGAASRNAIYHHINSAGVLLEQDKLASLEDTLRTALDLARDSQTAHFILPCSIASPDLVDDYTTRGWLAPGIKLGSFKPALFKIWWKSDSVAELELIEIRFSTVNLSPDHINHLQISLYQFLLARLLPSLIDAPSTSPQSDALLNLRFSPVHSIWAYGGCVTPACDEAKCGLGAPTVSVSELQEALLVSEVVPDLKNVEKVLFEYLPMDLEATSSVKRVRRG